MKAPSIRPFGSNANMSLIEKFSLSGLNILLTGATGHLGNAMAWSLAECGANVLVNARSEHKVGNLVQDLVMLVSSQKRQLLT